jgi:superfamily II helicase
MNKLRRVDSQGPQAKTPLAMIVRMNFDVVESEFILDELWASKLALKSMTQVQVMEAIQIHNNVAKETNAVLRVIKKIHKKVMSCAVVTV